MLKEKPFAGAFGKKLRPPAGLRRSRLPSACAFLCFLAGRMPLPLRAVGSGFWSTCNPCHLRFASAVPPVLFRRPLHSAPGGRRGDGFRFFCPRFPAMPSSLRLMGSAVGPRGGPPRLRPAGHSAPARPAVFVFCVCVCASHCRDMGGHGSDTAVAAGTAAFISSSFQAVVRLSRRCGSASGHSVRRPRACRRTETV